MNSFTYTGEKKFPDWWNISKTKHFWEKYFIQKL